MKIDLLSVSSFGKLKNLTINLKDSLSSQSSLVVIKGKNESGKSTLFHVLTTLLFGFEQASLERHPYAPWDGYLPEIYAEGTLDCGESFEIHRKLASSPRGKLIYKGQSHDLNNRPLPFCSHVNPDLYREIYSLDLDKMVMLRDMTWEKVQNMLTFQYDGDRSPQQILSEIEQEMQSLWRPDQRGKPKARQLQDKIRMLQEEKREACLRNQSMYRLEEEKMRLEEQLESKKELYARISSQVDGLQNAIPFWNELNKLRSIYKQYRSLPSWHDPMNPELKLNLLDERIRDNSALYESLKEKINSLKAGLTPLSETEVVLLGMSDRMRRLEQEQPAYLGKLIELQKVQERIDSVYSDFERNMNSDNGFIGAPAVAYGETRGRVPAEILAKVLDFPVNEVVEGLRRYSDYYNEECLLEGERNALPGNEEMLLLRNAPGPGKAKASANPSLKGASAVINGTSDSKIPKGSLISSKGYSAALKGYKRIGIILGSLSFIIGFSLVLGLLAQGAGRTGSGFPLASQVGQVFQYPFVPVMMLISLLATAISSSCFLLKYYLARKDENSRKSMQESYLHELDIKLEHIRNNKKKQMADLKRHLEFLVNEPGFDFVSHFTAELESRENESERQAAENIYAAVGDFSARLLRMSELAKELAGLYKEKDNLIKEISRIEWEIKNIGNIAGVTSASGILQENGRITNDQLIKSKERLEKLLQSFRQASEKSRNNQQIEQQIKQAEYDISVVSQKLDDLKKQRQLLLSGLSSIGGTYQNGLELISLRRQIEAQLPILKRQFMIQYPDWRKKLEVLFETGGYSCSDEEAALSVEDTSITDVDAVLSVKDTGVSEGDAGLGRGPESADENVFDTALSLLSDEEYESIRAKYSDSIYNELKSKLEDVRKSISQTEKNILMIENEIRSLLEKPTPDELEGELEYLNEQLNDVYYRRDRLALLAAIIRKKEKDFREVHQPDVLRRAGEYLNLITDGKYTRLFTEEKDDHFVLMVREKGTSFPITVDRPLSRGTLEQIYLCLRLALVEHLDEGAETLPVFLDEVFVNWDMERTMNGLNLLSSFCNARQVFLFTCRDEFADLVSKKTGALQVNLEEF